MRVEEKKKPDILPFFFSAPVVAPTDVAGYGGRNGEIVITWQVSKPSVHATLLRI